MSRHIWVDAEVELLKEKYPIVGADEVSRLLGLNIVSVRNKVAYLHLRTRYVASKLELPIDYIANLYNWGHTPREIAKMFGVSLSVIHRRLKLSGVCKRDKGSALRGKKITDKRILKKWSIERKVLWESPEYRAKHSGVNGSSYGRHHKLETIALLKRKLIGNCAGEKSPHWVGGVLAHGRYSRAFKRLAYSIRERDVYQCKVCHKSEIELNKRLCVHHIDYDKNNIEEQNLVSLCRSCHSKTNHHRAYWESYLEEVIKNDYNKNAYKD